MVQRSWPATLAALVSAVVLLAWASRAIHDTFLGGAVLGVLSLLAAFLAYAGPGSATCPLCGKVSGGKFASTRLELESCEHCKRYYSADGKEVPADFVATRPSFSIKLTESTRLPALCCVCGEPSDRVKELVHVGAGHRHEGKVIKETIKVPIPYCGKHDENVKFLGFEPPILIVRSYAFYRKSALG